MSSTTGIRIRICIPTQPSSKIYAVSLTPNNWNSAKPVGRIGASLN